MVNELAGQPSCGSLLANFLSALIRLPTHCAPPPLLGQATEIYYDPDPKTTIIEEDREWVEGYFDLNEVGGGAGRVGLGGGLRLPGSKTVGSGYA